MLLFIPAIAQKSSKSKSADKIYERGVSIVEIHNVTAINSDLREFSPTFYLNGIVYVGQHRNGPIDPQTGESMYDIFYAESDRDGNLLKPDDFSLWMNSEHYEGPVTFNKNGDIAYFTRSNLKNGIRNADKKNITGLKIYEAHKGPYDWQDIEELPFNNDNYSVCHPSLSADGKRLYFASNMPGGFGKMDIYYCEKEGKHWSMPINLGPKVNTDQNEVFPFIHESGVLFFSSKAHNGLGGLDIFRVDMSGDEPGEVSSMGAPYNSDQDDFGFILEKDGTYGYFASNREGGKGKDDIYMFTTRQGVSGTTPEVLASTILVTDAATHQAVDRSAVRVFELAGDNFIDAGGDLYNVVLMPQHEGSNELVMKLVRKNAEELGKPDMYTREDGKAFCDLKGARSYMIIVSKDGYESAEVNFPTRDLSGPQTIPVELKTRKCVPLNGRVSVMGYNTPVQNAHIRITNTSDNSTQEVQSNSNGAYEYCLKPGNTYQITTSKDGYEVDTSRFSPAATDNSLSGNIALKPLKSTIVDAPLKVGSVIVLNNIYYDFNKSVIRTGAARELDALIALMNQYPDMEVQLIAHTDSRGSTEFNQDLSLRRAESAKTYLVSNGIAGNRIQAIGKGESEPRNRCVDGVDCTEEEYQYNRRTEVKVTKIEGPVKVEYGNNGPEVIDRKQD